jgi:hypothetical protein
MLRVNAPDSIAKSYPVGTATFGSRMTIAGVSGSIAAVEDVAEPEDGETAAGTTRDGCSSFLNASAVIGRIALIDRGRCFFVTKAQNAKAAGAIGVIIADNRSAPTPPGMAGTDPTLDIPVISVTQIDGAAIRAQLGSGVNATIGSDTTKPLAGTDANGRVKLYAPSELTVGSSVFHWDITADPNALMEPFINDDLSPNGVDITFEQLIDVGWTAPAKIPSGRRILRRGR